MCEAKWLSAGFSGSEVGNKYPRDPAVLNKALGLRGLTICNAWFSSFLTTRPLSEVEKEFIAHRDFLFAVGARVIGAAEQGNSIQGKDVSVFGAKPVVYGPRNGKNWALDSITWESLRTRRGMKLTYHHHMGTGVQTTAEIDRLMEMTEPGLCDLLYDTGHLVFSGEDHLVVLRKYASRIKHVHLKDVRPAVVAKAKAENWSFLKAVKSGAFTVPGDGSIDFVPVFEELKRSGYEGWWVVEAEQDPALANPFEYAVKARTYIRQKAGF